MGNWIFCYVLVRGDGIGREFLFVLRWGVFILRSIFLFFRVFFF